MERKQGNLGSSEIILAVIAAAVVALGVMMLTQTHTPVQHSNPMHSVALAVRG